MQVEYFIVNHCFDYCMSCTSLQRFSSLENVNNLHVCVFEKFCVIKYNVYIICAQITIYIILQNVII